MRESDTSTPRRRTKVYGVVLAGFVAAGSLILAAVTQQPKSAVSSPGPAKAAIVPQIADTKSEEEILFRGKSFALLQRAVTMPYSGEILEIHVKEGQAVDQDQTLVTYKLDRQSVKEVQALLYPADIQNLKSSIFNEETTLAKLKEVSLPLKELNEQRAKKELQDVKELASRGLAEHQAVKLKHDQVETVEKELLELRKSIKQVESTIANMKKDLKFREENRAREVDLLEWNAKRSFDKDSKLPHDIAYLKAPITGHVMWLNPDLRVEAEQPRGFLAARLSPMESMLVRRKVHELDLVKLKTGDKGTVTFDAIPEKPYPCKLTRIPLVSRNPALEVPADYEIEALLHNPDGRILDGMTCNVKVSIRE